MLSYRVEDMTCGHCASAITKAIAAEDADARVTIDLVQRLVHVEPRTAAAGALHDAIAAAGYSPVPVKASRCR